ncbi:MAG: cyanophycin synthetase [Patescibacteria group bacterium]
MKRKHGTLITGLLKKIAVEMGVTIHLEPKWGYVGQITLPDGRKRYFRNTMLDLNSLGSAEIAADKDYTDYFLKRLGYPTIPGRAFFSTRWNKTLETDNGPKNAYAYAKAIGFPVIVKPNSLTQGAGVTKVESREEFFAAVKRIERDDRVFLVQQLMHGHDYRIVVLDDEVISAYERLPLTVTGDGRLTIKQLLLKKQRTFDRIGRDTQINPQDPRITLELKRQQLTRGSIVKKGQVVQLLTNANLSTGGDAIDATKIIHPEWKTLACTLAREMNLRYIGIDVMVQGTLETPPNDYVVIEMNAAPGLDNYVTMGKEQEQIVERLYRKVVEALLK